MNRKRVVPCAKGCGVELVSPKGRAPYFCDICREAATRVERRAVAWRRWRTKAGYEPGSLAARPCQACGQPFARSAGQYNKRYCGPECAAAGARERTRERRGYAARNREQVCARPECGKPFTRGPRQQQKLYCSEACTRAAAREHDRASARERRSRRDAKPKRAALFALARQIYREMGSTPNAEAA